MTRDDLIIAFFPCTRFDSQIGLWFRGQSLQQKNQTQLEKLHTSMRLHEELHDFYERISMMTCICIERGLRLIIENPYTQPHYLTLYWCIKPSVIDMDRTKNGDHYKKPTQYWFINCEPEENFIFEPIQAVERYTQQAQTSRDGKSRAVMRSMIHPQYANRFIRQKIIGEKDENQSR